MKNILKTGAKNLLSKHKIKSLYPAYEKIVKVSSGNEQAIKEILRFYDGYITKLCLRPFYHENGKVSMRIDEELKGEVQTELMKAMLRFQLKVK